MKTKGECPAPVKLANYLLIFLTLFTVSCSKPADKNGSLRLYMCNSASEYISINAEIQSFEIHYTDHGKGWVKLHTIAGVHNLLGMRNPSGSILADDESLAAGTIDQVRLKTGTNNSLETKDSVLHKMLMSSDAVNGVIIPVEVSIKPEQQLELQFNFKAASSVYQQEDSYYFNPELELTRIGMH